MKTNGSELTPNMLFENEEFAIGEKPAGWLTVPSRQGRDDPRPCFGIWLQQQLAAQIYPVHRLDVCVSGLVLWAKTPEAQRIASGWFEMGQIIKQYEAWTSSQNANSLNSERFVWISTLSKGKKRAYLDPKRGKLSETHATIEHSNPQIIVWSLWPKTGRPHQLRFELSHRGFPILGDALYGSQIAWAEQSIALHMKKLDFSLCPKANQHGLPTNIAIQGISDVRDAALKAHIPARSAIVWPLETPKLGVSTKGYPNDV
jgi:tRNA pseudouridine32 synthase/23S rRNA pseudouridine746 synthase